MSELLLWHTSWTKNIDGAAVKRTTLTLFVGIVRRRLKIAEMSCLLGSDMVLMLVTPLGERNNRQTVLFVHEYANATRQSASTELCL